ncbi:hypothetical protein EML15_04385 [Corynebacterium sp. sy017]|uniref:YfhO family protein n=1 Tax=unclassified Corynebacterium TaxID=2624378 RepID=UPI001184716F|nr:MULTISPECIES: YfhO family protein [unclassified Corynebacterium]MBP3088385.1 hypothetical protein [Corynebacterium sp. sy017]TSD91700.1 hypothetical protein ELY17_04385 [Corynebacterium sp. SY003]
MQKSIDDNVFWKELFEPKSWVFTGLATLVFGIIATIIESGIHGLGNNISWYVGSIAIATPGLIFILFRKTFSRRICIFLSVMLVTTELVLFLAFT